MPKKHTPGPWEASKNNLDVVSKDGFCICTIHDNWLTKEEAQANIDLISSAPKLLEHGFNLVALCLQSERYHIDDDPEFVQAVDNLLYAHWKATGYK